METKPSEVILKGYLQVINGRTCFIAGEPNSCRFAGGIFEVVLNLCFTILETDQLGVDIRFYKKGEEVSQAETETYIRYAVFIRPKGSSKQPGRYYLQIDKTTPNPDEIALEKAKEGIRGINSASKEGDYELVEVRRVVREESVQIFSTKEVTS